MHKRQRYACVTRSLLHDQPPLPALALLLIELMKRNEMSLRPGQLAAAAIVLAMIGFSATAAYTYFPQKVDRSDRTMIALWRGQNPGPDSKLVYWNYRRELSAAFYSRGRAVSTQDSKVLSSLLQNGTQDYIVTRSSDLDKMPEDVKNRFEDVAEDNMKNVRRILLREKPPY